MQKWEYETFAFTAINGGELKKKLNELGQAGWEYCGASAFPISIPTGKDGEVADGMLYCYLFKRPEALIKTGDDVRRAFERPKDYGPGNPQFINGG